MNGLNIHSLRNELARGTYAVIQVDPVASCAGANDPEMTALARRLPSKKYLAVITEFRFMPKPQWGVHVVSQGFPTPDKIYALHEGQCTPIFPTTEHPQGREALRANKEFPWKNCYHHSLPGREWLAVSSVSSEGATGIQLPKEEVDRLFDCFLEDSYEASDAREKEERRNRMINAPSADKCGEAAAHPSVSCEENLDHPSLSPPLPPDSHESQNPVSDGIDPFAAEPYDDFSDVTSIVSCLSRDSGCSDGSEGFICALESCLDPYCITPTIKVWLDLSVFDSETLPPVMDFWAELQEIYDIYFIWKAKQDAKASELKKQKKASATPRRSAPDPTPAPNTDKSLKSTRLSTVASRVRYTVKSLKCMLRRFFPLRADPAPKKT